MLPTTSLVPRSFYKIFSYVAIGGLVLLVLFLYGRIALEYLYGTRFAHASGVLKVSVLNIGQGDSILIQGPTGKTMLVDAGPGDTVLDRLAEELGPLNHHLDMVVETHPDADHITGFEYVLQKYTVSQFMTPGIPDSTKTFLAVDQEASALESSHALQKITARRGMRIDLGGGAYADVLHPDRDLSQETVTNDGSITMHLVYGKTSFMLTGDLPTNVENWLVQLDAKDGELPTDVLKVGHHGSKYSTGSAWLAALHPSVAAISVGKNNRYGHPAPATLDRIKAEGATIYMTEDSGTLDFISDGEKITEHSEGL